MLHTTREGERILIACMDDSHLKATINLHLRVIEQSVVAMTTSIDDIAFIVAGIDQDAIRENAREEIYDRSTLLGPYLLEAVIRGMDFSARVQEVFKRTAGLVNPYVPELFLDEDSD